MTASSNLEPDTPGEPQGEPVAEECTQTGAQSDTARMGEAGASSKYAQVRSRQSLEILSLARHLTLVPVSLLLVGLAQLMQHPINLPCSTPPR